MRKHLLSSALITTILLPWAASAVTLQDLDFAADCNGWTADVTVAFRPGAMMARLEYAVVLQDAVGAELERHEFSDWIDIPDTPTAVFSFAATWPQALEGGHEVSGDFAVYDIYPDGYNLTSADAQATLTCGDTLPLVETCRYPVPYWAQNPAQWPLDSIQLGGEVFEQARLQLLLNRQVNWTDHAWMASELAAAKLNVANGATDPCHDLIARADARLLRQPLCATPWLNHRRADRNLARRLAIWNGAGCPDGTEAGNVGFSEGVPLPGPDLGGAGMAAEEIMNLGTLKSMFR